MASEALRDDSGCQVDEPGLALAGIAGLAEQLMTDLDTDAILQRAAEIEDADQREQEIEAKRQEMRAELQRQEQQP